MNPKIVVIIVNWNKKKDVIKLLSSLKHIDYDNFFTVVVDNASKDDSVESIGRLFPNVELILNSTNLGGSGGFNIGIDYVRKNKKFDYIWILDNDAVVEKNTLSELIKVMQNDGKNWNATRGGNLNIFPRVNFDSLF